MAYAENAIYAARPAPSYDQDPMSEAENEGLLAVWPRRC